ncbi:MAG: beta-ketoacyl synthase N-terminal-like domain-containing protein [Candidatus Lokiarchaeia archaeon]
MRKVAVVGIGSTKYGKSDKTCVEMFAEAGMDAMHDANTTPKDVEALYLGNVLGDYEEDSMNIAPFCAAEIGLKNVPATKFETACSSATAAFRDAYTAIAAGLADIVMAGGTERALLMGTALATKTFAMGTETRYEQKTGITFPGVFGMMANAYSKKYNIPMDKLKELMAMVAVKNHHNGAMNPKAHLGKEITLEKALNAPMIADPLNLYSCCPFSDGASACILATEDVAKKLTDTPIWVAGTGMGSAGPLYMQKDITKVIAREAAAQMAYKQAKLEPKDIDLCELHDCFTIAEIAATEGLGFFKIGEGWKGVEEGETSLDGRIPVNTSGGLKSKGHPIGATGVGQVYEIVTQLRGEAGPRQVDGAEIGYIDTLGGDLAAVVNIILRR